MRCRSCNGENAEGANFCSECGTAFVRLCPSCGQPRQPTAKFCSECGTPLQARSKEQGAWSKEQKPESPNPKSRILNPDPQSEAEACFLKAIDIAQKQQAKSWELRASTSLARLWQQQHKSAEAHTMLSEIYGWFTEGFDTKDLQEAKALLDELAEGR